MIENILYGGKLDMGFLISHWHCILPVAGIIIAVFFMLDKPQDKKNKD